MLSSTIVALFAVTIAASPAINIKTPRDDLQPWQITTLYTHSPSGRPGNDLHLTLNATIVDLNTLPVAQTPTGTAVFPSSTANCSAQWLSRDDIPLGVEIPCTPIRFGHWTMKLLPGDGETGTGATTNFGLEFKLVDNVTVLGMVYTRTFTGEGKFKVGDNLSGNCGGSGVCNWGLTTRPYLMTQTEQS
ncbi:hypothetical protein HYALB_00014009 [Hymenoscyphus albidus]|uniref:Uncharacterized protein n=1 Tax=Hymenoscyphus albidus TaxID=595503 RepID=A0A9N9LVX7_9HELO|nr:hypothetical protein HYALB_00014009 [Hymenoscyphus albidus]